jgi:hypothetical protein
VAGRFIDSCCVAIRQGSRGAVGGEVASRDVGEGGHAEVDGGGAAGDEVVQLGELGVCCGQADLESPGFAAPAFAFGFGDAGDEVVADVHQPRPLSRVGSQEWASDAAVLVDALGAVGSAAVAERDLAAFEVAEGSSHSCSVGLRCSSLGRSSRGGR